MNRLDGKTALVTGATSGIGLETARGLAMLRARVLVHGRTEEKAAAAVAAIKADAPHADLVPVAGDFAAFAAVRSLAGTIAQLCPALDILVHNAGLLTTTPQTSADGHELQWAVNHHAPFLLNALLLPLLRTARVARIVIVSSHMHRRAKLSADDIGVEGIPYSGLDAYARTKLANILFSNELARRLKGTAVTANALHPGAAATHLGEKMNGLPGLFMTLSRPFLPSAEIGAKTSLHLASSPLVAGVTGGYFRHSMMETPAPLACDAALAQALWARGLALTGAPDTA